MSTSTSQHSQKCKYNYDKQLQYHVILQLFDQQFPFFYDCETTLVNLHLFIKHIFDQCAVPFQSYHLFDHSHLHDLNCKKRMHIKLIDFNMTNHTIFITPRIRLLNGGGLKKPDKNIKQQRSKRYQLRKSNDILKTFVENNAENIMLRTNTKLTSDEIIKLCKRTNQNQIYIKKWMNKHLNGLLHQWCNGVKNAKEFQNILYQQLRKWLLQNCEILLQRKHPFPTNDEKKLLAHLCKTNIGTISNWFYRYSKRILINNNKMKSDNTLQHCVPLLLRYIKENVGKLWYQEYTIDQNMIEEIEIIANVSANGIINLMTPNFIEHNLRQIYQSDELIHRIISDLLQLNVVIDDFVINKLHYQFNISISNIKYIHNFHISSYSKNTRIIYRYSCYKCNYYFSSRKQKLIHEKIPHGHCCEMCPMKFHHMFALSKHYYSKHHKVCNLFFVC